MKLPMLTNSKNKTSASFTMAFIAFNVIVLWLIAFLLAPSLGFVIPAFDGSTAMMFLTPILTNYFANNYLANDSKTPRTSSNDSDTP